MRIAPNATDGNAPNCDVRYFRAAIVKFAAAAADDAAFGMGGKFGGWAGGVCNSCSGTGERS